jgi:hypothetical protein
MMVSPLRLSFAHLNLRHNPFGELTAETRARLAVVDIEPLLPLLGRERQAIVFTGPQGHGKSTRLAALHEHKAEAPRVHVFPGEHPPLPLARWVFVDGLDFLSARERRYLARGNCCLAGTSHRDLKRPLARLGYRVRRVEVRETPLDTLQCLLRRRIEDARRGDGPIPILGTEQVRGLQRRFDHDIRTIIHHLYDEFQDLKEIDHVQV